MGFECSEATAVRQVPKPNRRVIAGADEHLTVRRDGERPHPACMAFQCSLFRHVGHVEQLKGVGSLCLAKLGCAVAGSHRISSLR